jgi:transposase InsO family protein
MDVDRPTAIALFRLSVLGPLISTPLEHGDRAAYFRTAAARPYELPDGRRIRIAARTIEGWYHAWKKGGIEALRPQPRSDAGRSRAIPDDIADWILRAKHERPRRSIRRVIRMLERAGIIARGALSRSAVHRLLQSHGASKRPPATPDKERRAFRHRAPGDLWMGDVMHSRMAIGPDGRLRKAYLHVFIDSATRLVPHAAFRLGEQASDLEAVFRQALMKYGRPRAIYLDRGPAQISSSLRIICAELDIRLIHCQAYDAPAKGAIERMIRTLREEVEEELPEEPIAVPELNSLLWAWIGAEYHVRKHGGTGQVPMQAWLQGAHEVRPLPRHVDLDALFLHRARRTVRKDGTVRFGSRLLEVRPELVGHIVELRFDPEDPARLPRVFTHGQFFCDTIPLDPIRNSVRPRRPMGGADPPPIAPTGIHPLDQIRNEHARQARPPRPEGEPKKKEV